MTTKRRGPDDALNVLLPKGALSRRKFLGYAAAAGAGALAAGEALAEAPASAASLMQLEARAKASVTAVGGTTKNLYIYTWGQYDNPTTFTGWQDGTKIALQFGSYNSDEEMIAKLELANGTAGYDIVVPTGGYIPEMAAKGLLEKLDHAKLPNFSKLDPAQLNFSWDPGNKYSIPKDFGTTGYIYDKTIITRKMTTWADFVAAAALPQVSGKVSVLDTPDDVLAIALWNFGIPWNTTSASKLRYANNWLIKHLAPHVSNLDSYPGSTGGLTNATYVLSEAWNGDARQAMLKDPERFAWVVPYPKSEIWVDNWCIAKGAKNVNSAHAFINYVIDPIVSANEMIYTGYNTAVKNVRNYLPKNLPQASVIFLTSAQEKRLEPYVVNSTYNLRTQLYDDFKAAISL
ncbi:MAG TPA: spermidine/putrescine ABC transporter substrate-binding protein [Acidimicrobiales bacterium]|nr:spermidine/putrescine ABC transporter substrate-binding protein [Acidimicrobiales bacterium]